MAVEVERFAAPTSVRGLRALERRRRGAAASLAGRTVWCSSAAARASGSAQRIRGCIERLGDGEVTAVCVEYTAYDLRPAGDALAAIELGPGDVVVICDPRTAALTPMVRESGAHAVWAFRAGGPGIERLLARYRKAIDALLDDALEPLGRGVLGERILARVPATRLAASKVLEPGASPAGPELGWGTALAEVVEHDRRDNVGGTLRARPAVAAR